MTDDHPTGQPGPGQGMDGAALRDEGDAPQIRILSIDGGGIRGLIPLVVLDAILGDLRAKDVFHLISGTSTGGIIACGLCQPKPTPIADLLALYRREGGEIFAKGVWQSVPGTDLLGPKYSAKALETKLKRVLGDTRLSDVSGTELLVPTYAIQLPRPNTIGETRAPLFFRSWRSRGILLKDHETPQQHDFFLRDVGRATSAAPTYFPPAVVRNQADEAFALIDGGVYANNPVLSALMEAYRLFGSTNMLVVSLGTGHLQQPISPDEAAGWGKIGWLPRIISILMDGTADAATFQADQLLDKRLRRFDVSLGPQPGLPDVNEEMDDASGGNIESLVARGASIVASAAADIAALRAVLTTPRSTPALPSAPRAKGILLPGSGHARPRA